MNKHNTTFIFLSLLFLALLRPVHADDVEILAADFSKTGDNSWSVSVTLKHSDTGWEHYADNWQVVDSKKNVLGDRVLHHPHVDKQPFTRSLNNVVIPEGVTIVFIEAHDKTHGWTQNRLKVDLSEATNRRLKIKSK